MKELKEAIEKKGSVKGNNILKVDSFLNHQMDIDLMNKMGAEFAKRFKGAGVNKILTIEASGIAVACITAQYFGNVPVVFAKKTQSKITSQDLYTTKVKSFTKGTENEILVSKSYLSSSDKVLIVDDFLATGSAVVGLLELCEQAKAEVVGCAIVVEKSFDTGGKIVRGRNVRVESLARILKLEPPRTIVFDE